LNVACYLRCNKQYLCMARRWIFIVLAHWNNSLWVHVSPLWANQSLHLLLNAAWLAFLLLFGLTQSWLESMIYRTQGKHAYHWHYTSDAFDRHFIFIVLVLTEILLKVALNTITLTLNQTQTKRSSNKTVPITCVLSFIYNLCSQNLSFLDFLKTFSSCLIMSCNDSSLLHFWSTKQMLTL